MTLLYDKLLKNVKNDFEILGNGQNIWEMA